MTTSSLKFPAILTQQEFVERYRDKFKELRQQGYHWDKDLSTSCAGVVFSNGTDMWVFSLNDEEPVHADIKTSDVIL